MKNPSIVIVIGRDRLLGYMLYPGGNAELVERVEFQCDTPTSCPLIDWTDKKMDPYPILGRIIEEILCRYCFKKWGLVCSTEHCEGVVGSLANPYTESLVDCLENDSEEINITNVSNCFDFGYARLPQTVEHV
jgi:hypothetical protein